MSRMEGSPALPVGVDVKRQGRNANRAGKAWHSYSRVA
jgi:hypothetical protein